jgi:hypothetical protein
MISKLIVVFFFQKTSTSESRGIVGRADYPTYYPPGRRN